MMQLKSADCRRLMHVDGNKSLLVKVTQVSNITFLCTSGNIFNGGGNERRKQSVFRNFRIISSRMLVTKVDRSFCELPVKSSLVVVTKRK